MLEVADLKVAYQRVPAVRGVSLSVAAGSIVGLVGANGAGKTSTLNAITGLVPSTGAIGFDGEPLTGTTADVMRRGVAQVAQGRQLFADMTVVENLELGGFVCAARQMRERVERVMDQFPLLRERARQRAGTLSGGEQQMLAVARALMSAPRLLMIDEPCLGLSPKMVLRLGELIERLHADGLSILLVEQNTAFVFGLAHHAFVIENGRVVLSGTPEMLRQDDKVRTAYLGI